MDENSYGAKEKHDIVQRMANKFIEHKDHGPYSPYVNDKYVEVSAAGKGMSGYLGEDCRGKKFVDDLNTKAFMPGDFSIALSHEGAATVFRMGGVESKSNTAASPYQFYVFADNTLSYCTSQQRSVGYVFHEAEKNPGLYAHQKELGLSLQGVADILTAAKDQTDMEILEKLSKILEITILYLLKTQIFCLIRPMTRSWSMLLRFRGDTGKQDHLYTREKYQLLIHFMTMLKIHIPRAIGAGILIWQKSI
ncbi:MAG: hypothetical protein E7304_03595 [Butyrivibrio sp.]|nr:hypothetical protein [Butyrivibrio sp.]